MNKSDIVGRLPKRLGLTRSAAESAVNAVLDSMAEALAKEDAVRFAGFRTNRTKSREAQSGRNAVLSKRLQ